MNDIIDRRIAPHERNLVGKRLTTREQEILNLLADGRGTEGVSEVLGLSENTVRSHLRRIRFKLNAHDRAHSIAMAIRSGQLHLGRWA